MNFWLRYKMKKLVRISQYRILLMCCHYKTSLLFVTAMGLSLFVIASLRRRRGNLRSPMVCHCEPPLFPLSRHCEHSLFPFFRHCEAPRGAEAISLLRFPIHLGHQRLLRRAFGTPRNDRRGYGLLVITRRGAEIATSLHSSQ